MEPDGKAEAQDAIRNLVLMLASLTMCGHTELKPSTASMGSLFQMLNFTLPQPSNRGKFTINDNSFVWEIDQLIEILLNRWQRS